MVSGQRRKDKRAGSSVGPSGQWWGAGAGALVSALGLAVVLAAAVYGLERMRDRVLSLPEYNPVIKVELGSAPDWVNREGWRGRILSAVELPENEQWLGGDLLRCVYDQMMHSGWVSQVRRVTQDVDGTVRIFCRAEDYRRPIAMLLTQEGYLAVDRQGVRLPEVYDFVGEDSGWMRVVGLETPPPAIGSAFAEDTDAMAAVRIATLIFDQEFAPRITGIDVTNFRGRRNRRENHVTLRTRDGGTIIWGSAIGEEMEELSAAEKIANIALYFKKGSRQAYADVSVYRGGWIEPARQVIRTADGSGERDR